MINSSYQNYFFDRGFLPLFLIFRGMEVFMKKFNICICNSFGNVIFLLSLSIYSPLTPIYITSRGKYAKNIPTTNKKSLKTYKKTAFYSLAVFYVNRLREGMITARHHGCRGKSPRADRTQLRRRHRDARRQKQHNRGQQKGC